MAFTAAPLWVRVLPSHEQASSQKVFSFLGSMQKLSSQSMNTGVANWYFTGFTAAMKVRGGTSTTSPGFTPASTRERWRAEVPLWQAAVFVTPRKAAIDCSSFVMYAPPVETHP